MRPLLLVAAAVGLGSLLRAQPAPPNAVELAVLRDVMTGEPPRAAASIPLTVNVTSREEVRQFYRAIHEASEGVPMNWTGSYASGNAGDTSAAFKDAVALRINFFRALVGVPAAVTLNATYSTKAQDAALMMSANSALSHFPPTSWTFYTANGAEAAGKSNIALGSTGPDSINGYMNDDGSNNAAVGHRRWLIYPQTREMGTGDVPGDSSLFPANAIWVQDGLFGTTRPATRTTSVPYPPAGYVPYTVVWPRWSFSYPNANFSNATVTMSRNGQGISAVPEPISSGLGESTLVWVYDGQNTTVGTNHARPSADTTYTVNISNVVISGAAQSFTYNVTVFDPDAAGPDYLPVTLTGSAFPVVGAANSYGVSRPSFAGSFDWRLLQLASFLKSYGAESGLDGITATTTPGYAVVQSGVAGAGSASYHLAHPLTESQFLLLPETFLVGGISPAITFLSRLGWATTAQIARVQVSTDDGVSWADVYAQTGSGGSGESSFATRNASLAGFSGRSVRVRFAYTVDGSRFPQTTSGIGWYIDNVTLSGVQNAAPGTATAVTSGTTFSYNPSAAGTVGLQARGVLFGAYPLEWGPVSQVAATVGSGSFTTQPASQAASAGGNVTFTAVATGSPTYQWQFNGSSISGATNSSLTVDAIQPVNTGLYTARVTSGGVTLTSLAAVLGVSSTTKLIGPGTEFPNIFHGGTGFTYDQILLEGGAAAVTADPTQILRISYIDLNNDIVQVEFSGAGTLSLVLEGVSGPALPLNYNQAVTYMKGHAGIVLSGANETTHLSVFSVGRANAVNQTLFRDEVTYDGLADIAFVAITSTDGKFGGLRTANASYIGTKGLTGVYAPGVEFTGPVFVGDIRASDDATPSLVIGAGSDVRITGGDLLQDNGRAVQVNGITQLRFTDGSSSHGTLFSAQANRARLEQNGMDVTAQIVVNP